MTDSLTQFRSFLDTVLPDDYAVAYAGYREDEDLRRRFQAAMFDEGWLIPDWPHGLGGRDLPRTEALTIRIEGARLRIPREMNIGAIETAAFHR